jgi:hypothetical protein
MVACLSKAIRKLRFVIRYDNIDDTCRIILDIPGDKFHTIYIGGCGDHGISDIQDIDLDVFLQIVTRPIGFRLLLKSIFFFEGQRVSANDFRMILAEDDTKKLRG